MIVSGGLGQKILPIIESWSQLELVYVLSRNGSYHEQWTKKISKIKGVYTDTDAICDSLQVDRQQCDREMISISFNNTDPLFMYTQLLKEALLEIDDDDETSIQDLVNYCHHQANVATKQIQQIQNEYRAHSPIWWYTTPYFIHSMVNRGLRDMDVEIILKLGFFIRHLHHHIAELYTKQQKSIEHKKPFIVFRGQGLSLEDFEKLKQAKGGLMTFNNFLSTSYNRDISLQFARTAASHKHNNVGILFVMNIDPDLCNTTNIPFASVSSESYYKDKEAEMLFTTHTIFRITRYKRIDDPKVDRLWEVELTLVGANDYELNHLISHIRKELQGTTGWSRLAHVFIRMGENTKAEQLYNILLDKPCSDIQRSTFYNNIDLVYDSMGEYSKALQYLEKARVIWEKSLPKNHSHIGMVRYSIELVREKL